MKKILRRWGLARSMAASTLAAVLCSVLLTLLCNWLMLGGIKPMSMLLAVLIPLVVAPLLGGLTLRLYFQIDRIQQQLELLSMTDELTGAHNRGHFFRLAAREFALARRHGGTFSILLADIDDFKTINDRHGHLAGDRALRTVADLCARDLRQTDLFARYGGEEFVFLLPHTSLTPAAFVANRVRLRIAEHPLPLGDKRLPMTISIGVATFRQDDETVSDVLARADKAMYAAKARGKNRVVGEAPGGDGERVGVA